MLFRFSATTTVLRDWSSTINCICFITNYMLVFNYICLISNYMLDLNNVVNQMLKSFYPNGQTNAVWPCIQPCSFQNLALSFQASYHKIKIDVFIKSKLPQFFGAWEFQHQNLFTRCPKKKSNYYHHVWLFGSLFKSRFSTKITIYAFITYRRCEFQAAHRVDWRTRQQTEWTTM